MIETMHEYIGVGLARRRCTSRSRSRSSSATRTRGIPTWPHPADGDHQPGADGGLRRDGDGLGGLPSIPDFRGVTPRYAAMRLEAYGRNGERIDLVAKDFFARVLQHETDHLNGKVDVDRMGDLTTLCHLQEWSRSWLTARSPSELPPDPAGGGPGRADRSAGGRPGGERMRAGEAPGTIVAHVRDLLFSSRIAETAAPARLRFRAARSLDDLRAALESHPRLVMLDLTSAELDPTPPSGRSTRRGGPRPFSAGARTSCGRRPSRSTTGSTGWSRGRR